MKNKNKCVIFGIDGGTFTIIDKLLAEGRLPTFARLLKEGTCGTLKSTIPPHTAPGWTSICTGVGPGTHGVYQFWQTQGPKYTGDFVNSGDWKTLPLWAILNAYGLNTGMVNIPMTHPPCEVDGFLISWPLVNTLRYSYPKELLNEIAKAGGHFIPDLFVMYKGQKNFLAETVEITRKRAKTIEYLIKNKPWDFLFPVFPEVDRISHFFWHYMDERSPLYDKNCTEEDKNAVYTIYETVDEALATVLRALPDETLFMVVSDHGFDVGTINFNVQSFLLEKGFLKLKEAENSSPRQCSAGGTPENVEGNWFTVEKEGKKFTVDWENSKAFIAAPGSYGININLKGRQESGIVEQKDFKKVCRKLIRKLLKLKHPHTSERLFEEVVFAKDIYTGEQQDQAPDLILIPADYGTMVHHSIVPGEVFSMPEQKGMHHRDGIFIARGPGVKQEHTISASCLEDIAPTVLHYFGIPIPPHIEGDVLPLFQQKIKPFRPPMNFDNFRQNPNQNHRYTQAEQETVTERLTGLGYL
ncbi:MAG: hypothetical protein GY757_37105 [bacterium]|nr:hypothetical protein [bacterium]